MTETDLLWMSVLIFAPSVFALLILFVPKGKEEVMRWLALFGSAVALAASIVMLIGYLDLPGVVTPGGLSSLESRTDTTAAAQGAQQNPQTGVRTGLRPPASDDWVSRIPWIKAFNVEYFLGVDGISVALVLMTTGLSFLALIASWKIERYVKGYLMLFLLLETGMVGCFVALDFFLFYIFWEVMLLPMYFLI